ncbi:stalk domain-containing protein [Paenibacillus chitinolyticus]|uniref:stalk domain-containing protein n=1 Tax=Paenibacillus chitinolyticus TaxID=79263 RepID=UPI0035D5CF1D
MKKKIIMLVAAFSVFAGVVSASSINGDYKGNAIVKVKVNGNYVNSEVPGINLDGTTMLPVRAISEALGAEVKWDQNTYTADVKTQGTSNKNKSVEEIASYMKSYNIQHVNLFTSGAGYTEITFGYSGEMMKGDDSKFDKTFTEVMKQSVDYGASNFSFVDKNNARISGSVKNAKEFFDGTLNESQLFNTFKIEGLEKITPPVAEAASNFYNLYSNDGKVYLGKITSNQYDPDSVLNQYGTYGSELSATSIFNKLGTYGGQFSQESAFNTYATKPPVIKDSKNNIVGYLTVNPYIQGAISPSQIGEWLKNN